MQYYLIMNPGSRGGASKKKFELIHSLFKNADFSYTKTLYDAYEFSKKANNEGYDAIIAVGGDGTINRVVNGFYNEDGKLISNAKFGVIYTGTSPDFCNTYNIPLDAEKAIRVISNGNVKMIDVGLIKMGGVSRCFVCCANIGLGAVLANNANRGVRKIWGDTLGTFIALIKTLCAYKPIEVEINGKKMNCLYNLSIGKTYYVASGLKIAHEIKGNDFYILPICNKILSSIIKLYRGKPLDVSYAEKIEIKGKGRIEFDGDEGGKLPCTITNAERLCVFCE